MPSELRTAEIPQCRWMFCQDANIAAVHVVRNSIVTRGSGSPRRLMSQGRQSLPGPRHYRRRCLLGRALVGLCAAWSLAQAQNSQPDLDRALQSATARYEAKDYAEAQKELEPLLARFPNSFEVNELTGLVYAAQGQDDEANRYLENAARFKPKDPTAHTNLAVNLVHRGKDSLAEVEFRKAVELDP